MIFGKQADDRYTIEATASEMLFIHNAFVADICLGCPFLNNESCSDDEDGLYNCERWAREIERLLERGK